MANKQLHTIVPLPRRFGRMLQVHREIVRELFVGISYPRSACLAASAQKLSASVRTGFGLQTPLFHNGHRGTLADAAADIVDVLVMEDRK